MALVAVAVVVVVQALALQLLPLQLPPLQQQEGTVASASAAAVSARAVALVVRARQAVMAVVRATTRAEEEVAGRVEAIREVAVVVVLGVMGNQAGRSATRQQLHQERLP